MSRRVQRSLVFWVALAVVAYAMLSLGIAVATSDACGELDATKVWNIFPPAWECR